MSSKITFSKEQQQAIESESKNLLVSASAGSGKTKVLIERIVRLVKTENVELSKMLVVTFTKLASLEMKSRLKKELEQESQSNSSLLTQLDEINVANISTLHQFCHNIIKEFFYVLQIEPNFNLFDDVNSSFYQTKAVENVFKNYSSKKDEDFESLYEIFYDSRNDKNFKGNIISTYNFLQSKQEGFFDWSIKNCYSTDFDKNPVILYIKNELKVILNHYLKEFEALVLPAQQADSPKLVELLGQAIERLKMISASSFDSVYTNYSSTEFVSTRGLRLSVDDREIGERFSELKSSFKDEMDSLCGCCYFKNLTDLEKDFATSQKHLQKFYEVVCEFDKEYKRLKKEKNALDFNDLEHYALKILEEKNVQKELQSRFDYIFVDEYQDTNEIQERLIALLTSRYTNVFMVGDVKQSIYAFRQSNPQIFINKEKLLLGGENSEVIRLNANYRSDKDILNFNNLIFDNVMRAGTCGIDYNGTSNFIFGESFKRGGGNLLPVNICLINKSKEKKELALKPVYSVLQDELVMEKDSVIEKEALVVTDKIALLLQTKIYDADLKTERFIDYKDIAILTRKKDPIKNIAKILMQKGIPVNAEYKINLYQSYAVKLIIEFLKLLQNSNDDIALAGVLKSSMFNFSDADLCTIKNAYSREQFCVASTNYALQKQDELAQKLQNFYDGIKKYRELLQYETITQVVKIIINDYKLLEKFFADKNYLEAKENLQFFINSIASIDDNNLTAFLEYIENYTKEKEELLSIKNSVNSVYVGTFHSSKGLEYPAVFVVGVEKPFSRKSITPRLIKNSDFGFGISSYDIVSKFEKNSMIKNIMKRQIVAKEKQDEMRLFYVALTRPKCYLFVVAGCDFDKLEVLDDEYSITHANSHLDYIMGSLGKETVDKIAHSEENILAHYQNLDINIELFDEQEIANVVAKQLKPNKVDVSYLLEYFDKNFEANDYAFKNTVTALMESENEQQIENYNIKNLKINLAKEDEQDFLLIGNNYHKIMQMLDFSSNEPALKQIEHLKSNGILHEKDFECVELSKIATAFENVKQLLSVDSKFLAEKQFMFYPRLCDVLKTNLTNKVLVQGVVDLLIINADEIIVVDYKTSRISSEKGFVDKYRLQLDLYAKAIESFYKKAVTKKIIYSFYLDKLIIVWQLQKISIIIMLWLMRNILICKSREHFLWIKLSMQ